MANRVWAPANQAFREHIKAIRIKAGLTQVELAAKLEKPQSYVSKYESGERKLDFVEVLYICEACDASPSKLAAELHKHIFGK
jgi:transcriptional regulator with XRE-family HTH domain